MKALAFCLLTVLCSAAGPSALASEPLGCEQCGAPTHGSQVFACRVAAGPSAGPSVGPSAGPSAAPKDDAWRPTLTVTAEEGPDEGKTFAAVCPPKYVNMLKAGDRCLVRFGNREKAVLEPLRERVLLVLAGLFVAAVGLAMGRVGFRILGSVVIAMLLIGLALPPLAERGVPPLAVAAVIAVSVCIGGTVLVGGWNRKSLCAAAGAFTALAIAVWVPILVSARLAFTGLEVEFGTIYHLDVPLWYSPALAKVDFRQLMLAGMIIASLGATMDVAMVVATTMSEVKHAEPHASRKQLLGAGLHVGRSILGIMIVAIVLLYAGGKLDMLLLHHLRGMPRQPALLLNYEEIGVEVVYAISTAAAMAFAVPSTAFISSLVLETGRDTEAS